MVSDVKLLVVSLAVLAAGACTKPNPASCADHHCADPALPFCDTDGALEGQPNTCIPVACTPGDVAACRGDEAIVCSDSGTNYDVNHCNLGCRPSTGCVTQVTECTPGVVRCGEKVLERCNPAGEFEAEACAVSCIDAPAPHCAYLEPQYLPDVCDVPATEAHLDLGSVNTDNDTLCNGGIVHQTDMAPDICVVRYKTITVPAGSTEAKISGSRVLALVADESVAIEGTLDVSADATVNGPGSGLFSSGGVAFTTGGGGAGASSPGAPGGSSSGTGGAANGGPIFAPSPILVLRGGARARSACDFPFFCAAEQSGGAGGAFAAIACRGAVTASGLIDAGGGGGHLGDLAANYGAGGGSGGFVALQALQVSVSGRVYANGGGGGDGKSTINFSLSGSDGYRSSDYPGGAFLSHDGGYGGPGELRLHAARPGTRGTGERAGGGGGAMGSLQVFTPSGVTPALAPADASPMFSNPRSVRIR